MTIFERRFVEAVYPADKHAVHLRLLYSDGSTESLLLAPEDSITLSPIDPSLVQEETE